MVLKYHISPYPALSEPMVVRIWEAQSDGPLGWVFEQVLPDPHDDPVTITANGLDKVVHIVRLYTQSGTLLHEYNAEPTTDTVTVFDPIRFTIGDGEPDTPLAGSDEYHNDLLAGLGETDYLIYRKGIGFLTPDVDVTYLADGFQLAAPDIFNGDPAEQFVIIRQPKISNSVVNDSVVGKWIAGVVDVAVNTPYDPAHLRKLIRFNGTCDYTFSALASIPIGYGFLFNHFGNVDGTGTVKFDNAPLRWDGATKDHIDIPRYCEACFVFDGVVWNVVFMCETKWVNAASPAQPGQNVAAGNLVLGNIPAGDPEYDIIHNMAIAGDYILFMSNKGTQATKLNDNDVSHMWYHHPTDKPNKVRICIQERVNGVQNLTISWLIVKL